MKHMTPLVVLDIETAVPSPVVLPMLSAVPAVKVVPLSASELQ